MSADDHTSSGPAGKPVDPRPTLSDGAASAVISRHQIESWAGRALTSGELKCLTSNIEASPMPLVAHDHCYYS
jgi:hypothetical protein